MMQFLGKEHMKIQANQLQNNEGNLKLTQRDWRHAVVLHLRNRFYNCWHNSNIFTLQITIADEWKYEKFVYLTFIKSYAKILNQENNLLQLF